MTIQPAMSDTFFEPNYRLRRQRVFLVFSGIFLGTLGVLNILGITRFLDFSFSFFGLFEVPMLLAVGVLPYPVTFLCTDLISELYGRKRATDMVVVGLVVNVWIVFFLWLGGALPGTGVDPITGEVLIDEAGRKPLFYEIQFLTFGSVAASMIAYLTAQYCDVRLFHFWKRITNGKHLWIRNNGSTLISQLVDTVAVILITHFYAHALPINVDEPLVQQLLVFIYSGYVFKLTVALVDTGPIYASVYFLRPYLGLKKGEEIDPSDFSETYKVVED